LYSAPASPSHRSNLSDIRLPASSKRR
jgi:hypothetical protein